MLQRGLATITSGCVIGFHRPRNNECTPRDFVGLDGTFPLTVGAPWKDHVPNDTTFVMDADPPTYRKRIDSLSNTHAAIVVSRSVPDFLPQKDAAKVECLPATTPGGPEVTGVSPLVDRR
jgi:hypothetical protein